MAISCIATTIALHLRDTGCQTHPGTSIPTSTARIKSLKLMPRQNYMLLFLSGVTLCIFRKDLGMSELCVGRCLGCWRDKFTLHLSLNVCICCSWACLLTASEFKRTSMGVHREILQLHGALRWYSQSERRSHASKVREQINQLCEMGHHHHHHHHLHKLAYLFNICFIWVVRHFVCSH